MRSLVPSFLIIILILKVIIIVEVIIIIIIIIIIITTFEKYFHLKILYFIGHNNISWRLHNPSGLTPTCMLLTVYPWLIYMQQSLLVCSPVINSVYSGSHQTDIIIIIIICCM